MSVMMSVSETQQEQKQSYPCLVIERCHDARRLMRSLLTCARGLVHVDNLLERAGLPDIGVEDMVDGLAVPVAVFVVRLLGA